MEADAWATHCQAVCAALAVPLHSERVRVKRAGQGLEAAAREARYRVFAGLATDALALAHQRDDQAETVLLQLLRGAGSRGLAAMPAARALGAIKLLRPLLDVTRVEIEAYAHAHGLSWVDDASNADAALRRNAVRHQLLPCIETLFPGASQTLARTASQFAETADLLDALAELDGAACRDGLEVARLRVLDAARGRNLLRRYLELHGVPIQRERLREAMAQMLGAGADAEPAIDFGAVMLRRFQGQLALVGKTPPPAASEWIWRGEAELDLGAVGRLIFSATQGEGARLPARATVRLRAGGEKLRPDSRRPARTLKNLLREAAVPPWLRARLPLIYVDDRLAWAAEIGADAAFQSAADEPGWLISWRRPA
jgi:tRNA(Ile)-lysidine synthase